MGDPKDYGGERQGASGGMTMNQQTHGQQSNDSQSKEYTVKKAIKDMPGWKVGETVWLNAAEQLDNKRWIDDESLVAVNVKTKDL